MNQQKVGLPSIHAILNSPFHDEWKETRIQRLYLPRVKLPSLGEVYHRPYLSANKRADPILHIHFQANAASSSPVAPLTAAAASPLCYSPASVATTPSPGSLYKPSVHTTTTTTAVIRKRRYNRYRCNQCAKVFSRPSSLRVHTLSHTGEKPHMCPRYGCGRRFSVYSNMRRHLKIHE